MVQNIVFSNRRAISKHVEILPVIRIVRRKSLDTRWEKAAHTRTPNERLR